MRIACLERYPLLYGFLRKRLADRPWRDRVILESPPFSRSAYPLALSEEGVFPSPCGVSAELVLLPAACRVGAIPPFCRPLFCGMGREDEITLSSVGEDRAMLCLQKEIAFGEKALVPQEIPIPFFRQYGLFKNAAVGFTVLLLDTIYGENA